MQATQSFTSPYDTDTPPVGTRVTNSRRADAVGFVKSPPWRDAPDRRDKVWVDYTGSLGVMGIDAVRDLEVAS